MNRGYTQPLVHIVLRHVWSPPVPTFSGQALKKKSLVTAHLQGYVGDALALYHGGLEAVGGELLHIGVPRGHVNF
jgi:hypothetical protein